MPYNNTPIAPSKDVTGTVSLPLARVQKIINADPERLNVSKNAAFAIALATEMFIQHLATTTHNVVKAERKPRRNIQYRDVSSAVAKTDNLEFAVDVVPKTTTYREFKKRLEDKDRVSGEKKGKGKAVGFVDEAVGVNGQGQTTLLGKLVENGTTNGVEKGDEVVAGPRSSAAPAPPAQGVPDAMDVDAEPEPEPERVEDSEPEEDAAAAQLEMEMRGPPAQAASPVARRSAGGFTAINGGR